MHFSLCIIPFSSTIFSLSWGTPHARWKMGTHHDGYSSVRDFALFLTLLWKKWTFCGWKGRRTMRELILLVPCCLRWLQHSLLPHEIGDLIYIYEHFWDNQSIIILIYISAYSHIHVINSPSICLKEMIDCMSWSSDSIKQHRSSWELIVQSSGFGIMALLRQLQPKRGLALKLCPCNGVSVTAGNKCILGQNAQRWKAPSILIKKRAEW